VRALRGVVGLRKPGNQGGVDCGKHGEENLQPP
jgi:hypothetical protein